MGPPLLAGALPFSSFRVAARCHGALPSDLKHSLNLPQTSKHVITQMNPDQLAARVL